MQRRHLTTLLVAAALALVAALPSAADAAGSGDRAIRMRTVATLMTATGVDLRLAVTGATGRVEIVVRFRRAGSHVVHRARRVIPNVQGRRRFTVHLHGLENAALYAFSARVEGGATGASVQGSFTVARRATPTVGTGANEVSGTAASLHATVAPNGLATRAWFSWGDGGTFAQRTAVQTFARDAGPQALTATLIGLVAGQSYSYRVVAESAGGTITGATRSFVAPSGKVGASPATATPPPATSAPPLAAPPAITTPITAIPPVSTTPPATAPLPIPTGPVFYVSTSGSDAADGSAAHPWQTLAMAAASTPPGGTAIVAPGAYAGFTMTRSGAAGAPIAIQAASTGTVHVTPAAGASTIVLFAVHDVTLAGLGIEGAQGSQNAGVDILDGSSSITISGNTIAGNHSYGVDVNGSTDVVIRGNTITGNDTGVRINRAGAGVLITGNDVVDNTGMVVDDPAPGNDWGAVGISFLHTTGPLVASGNTIHGNRAQSDDYGYDGGAFEIYGSSGDTMAGNRIWDNQDVVETGTDGPACAGNVFARNVAWGGNDKSIVSLRGVQVNGIILRCGEGMLIANNVFDQLDYWVYDIRPSGTFAGTISGFRIENNVSSQLSSKIYAIGSPLPADAVIDDNVSWNAPGTPFATVPTGSVASIEAFRDVTGQELHGRFGNPLFANAGGFDFHVLAGSPAIDAGTPIAGITDGYAGAAPDAGVYETG